MTGALTSGLMSPEIRKVVARARREPEGRFHSLAHLLDVPALAAAYWSIRKDAAVGVDGVTKDQYGQDVEQNLQDLYARLRSKRYRHQPIRRVHIPKDGGRTRPIGISALEDKIVQSAVRHVLEAIYEQDFLDCSFGFRPGRNAHEAIRALDKVVFRGEVNWILEADIVSFFDSLEIDVAVPVPGRVADPRGGGTLVEPSVQVSVRGEHDDGFLEHRLVGWVVGRHVGGSPEFPEPFGS